MTRINIALVRFIQFCIIGVYAYAVFVYAGVFLLLPIVVFYHSFNLLTLIGVNGILAALLALSIVVVIGYLGYKTPNLFQIIWDSGLKLAKLGFGQFQQLGAIAQAQPSINSVAASLSDKPEL